MAVCAEATVAELADALGCVGYDGEVEDLRPPEIGLVMVRGRIGGGGKPFNVGEATATRAAVRIAGGYTGFAYQLGRDKAKARLAALIDALQQDERCQAKVEESLRPISARLEREEGLRERRTAATRVNFFTMTRGEDE